jgi:preprotein translocase subunit YajC
LAGRGKLPCGRPALSRLTPFLLGEFLQYNPARRRKDGAVSTHLRYGDRVAIENLGVEGEVIEVDTRSVVVRYSKEDGELVEHRFAPDDLRYIPKSHLE